MIDAMKLRMRSKAATLLVSIETRLDRIILGWLASAAAASALRVSFGPLNGPVTGAELLPYILLVLAPVWSMILALRWFRHADRMPQPEFRLARVGSWRTVDPIEARRHALYGPAGIMVSLLIGMLLNVPVRAAEFLTALPPVPMGAPKWLVTLNFMMTLDVVLFASLYAIGFVAALRRVPLFPRLLAAIWIADVAMQLLIAKMVAGTPNLPAQVAHALQALLEGNINKVLISVAVWLPYLLLSTRVNVTYRHRLPA
jgi:hypothetical protein